MLATVPRGNDPAMTGRRRDIDDLRDEVQELFADLWQVPRFSGVRHGFRPQCDCFETDDPPTLHVVVELPGVDPGSVDVVVSGRSVVVAGTRDRPRIPGARYHAMEIEYGPFRRRLELGVDIDAAEAAASYERGILELTLPIARRTSGEAKVRIEPRS
jgi:HSP20 family molecular chaperone IbpA